MTFHVDGLVRFGRDGGRENGTRGGGASVVAAAPGGAAGSHRASATT